MRFLVDECLHESLVQLAHAAGLEATHLGETGRLRGCEKIADRSLTLAVLKEIHRVYE